ncbi:hypothetical protein [Gimesia sp.]|uniref:hypothetical protein n=1 Tax=Gimesia sp. TaxID=2024833 RepID=UPI003A903CA1
MAVKSIHIPRTTDTKVIEFYRSLCTKFGYESINIHTQAEVAINSVSPFESDDMKPEFKLLLEMDSMIIERCSANTNGLQVIYYRGGKDPENSPVYDTVHLNWNKPQKGQPEFSNKERLEINLLIVQELNPFIPDAVVHDDLSKEHHQSLAIHSEILTRLERLNEELIQKGTEYREQLDQDKRAEKAKLDANFEERSKSLEEEHKSKLEKIAKIEEELNLARQDIDDRNNTIVRRDNRDSMLKEVKDRFEDFGVSKATEKKRLPVFTFMSLLISVFTVLLIFSLVDQKLKIGATDSIELSGYYHYVRTTFCVFGLISSILYAIKWHDKWAKQHSDLEFELQQFNLDISRANWVIESCLEWKKETESDVPPELLDAMTRNLFKSKLDDSENVIHPADELASAILGSSSKMKLNIAGNEIELNPRKLPKKVSGGETK